MVGSRVVETGEAWRKYCKLIGGKPGNPTGNNQHTGGIRDTITNSSPSDEAAVDVIPFDGSPPEPEPKPEPKPGRKRDYSREAPPGNQNATGANQWTNRDRITVRPPGDESTLRSEDGKEVIRDNITNDLPYIVRRLSKDRPDLYERVLAGELNADAAMVEVGRPGGRP